MNIQNIPPLLANAVIKKPHEPIVDSTDSSFSASGSSGAFVSGNSQSECSVSQSLTNIQSQSSSLTPQSSADPVENTSHERSSTESFPWNSMANFLPENSFFYNEKNCYIFPGAEIWWNKDSDLESTSSDSSINDDDDDDDIEDMEISTMERNGMIGDVDTTIAVENLLENTNEHEFNKYLLKRNASTSLEHIQIEESDIDDLSAKRPRYQHQHHHHHHHHQLQSEYYPQSAPVNHTKNTSTMCDTLDSSSSSCSSSISNPTLPQNEVFSPKL